MPKNPSNKKGKKPIRPRRGAGGRWAAPSPEPDPPDDLEAEYASLVAAEDEIPVTAGGLVIREPSPNHHYLVNPQLGDNLVSAATEDGEDVARQSRLPTGLGTTIQSSPRQPVPAPMKARARVTVETVTDEDAPHRRAPSSSYRKSNPVSRVSPESEQRDSSIGVPVAQSTPQGALHAETPFESAQSATPAVSTTRFSRNSHSINRVMREHAERAEARAKSAYEQNRAALELISKSMNNVKDAFTEAKRARDRFHDLLSVSSRSRQNARRHTEMDTPSAQQAERHAIDRVRGVADYRRRLQSQVLSPEEHQAVQPSTVSSWRLRSGMYPASLSRLVEGENASMDLGTQVSTAKFTPAEAPRDMSTHRMGVRDWVADQRRFMTLGPEPEEPELTRQRAVPPVTRTDNAFARGELNRAEPPTRRTAGERISWLDRLNHPSTSRPYERDPPPHQPPFTAPRTAAGAPGGPPSSSSSSSTATVRNTPPPRAPGTPRRLDNQAPSSSEGSRVPEYLRAHRAPTFEPVTPRGRPTPARAPNYRGAPAAAPAPTLRLNAPAGHHERAGLIDPHNGGHNQPARRDIPDKITNMLSVAFMNEAQAAGRVDTVPLHKLGIKAALPKPYEGQPDQTSFENWLSLLLGFFRIHQLDVLSEAQDRARLEILGQALKDKAHTFFRERHQKLLEQGEAWDFREAILDLRDRYLYRNTPFVAARRFETIMQGNRDAQALYDDLTTEAARMIEQPSDYHFRIRFMLALRPEVLDYIIKTQRVSAEHSTLAQIRAACEDYERSNEYGRQLAATQTRLGGSRAPGAQQPARSMHNAHGVPQPHRSSQRDPVNSRGNSNAKPAARPHGEGQSRAAPPRANTKPDSRPKPAMRHPQKPGANKVSCFICGGPHYARDCPPENRKAARGYAVRIADEGAPDPANDADVEYHPADLVDEGENAQLPEPDHMSSDDDGGGSRLEGEQYDPDEDNAYPFSSSDDSEPAYSRATQIIATSALNRIESRAAKASKPTPSKTPHVESNRARYKIGGGLQPQRNSRLQRCIEVTVPINGIIARVLLDGGSNTNMISPEFATVAKVTAIELQEQMTLQLAVTGLRSKINYGTWVPMEFGPIQASTYFDIANIDGYDAILGTPFLWEHGVSPIYDDDGWVMKNGERIHFRSHPVPVARSGQSFRK